jgi:5-methylthioribose kinase
MKISLPLDDQVKTYLQENGIIKSAESVVSAEIAGQGNMNVVIRIRTSTGESYILKQSRPFVEKYPQIAAPEERILSEIAYYEAIKGNKVLEDFSPKILFFDSKNFLMVMSDLGVATDFSTIYSNPEQISTGHLTVLMGYLSNLHTLHVSNFMPNTAMKILNHEHIFNFPFDENNGFDLDTIQVGMGQIANMYIKDKDLKDEIQQMGQKYLDSGDSLLHGDFYPGSFMNTENGLKVIDPEFSFMGDREFDLGVLKAHLMMSKSSLFENFLEFYTPQVEEKLMDSYAGIEILRRLLGIAQLPLSLNLEEKSALCVKAKNMILDK